MDWALAIRRNREQLRQIVLALFVLAGLRPGRSVPVSTVPGRPLFTLPRSTFALIMLVLRPAESAVRRLIFIAAHELKLNGLAKSAAALTSPRLRGPQAGETGGSPWSVPGFAGRRGAYRAFALFEPLKSFDLDSIWDSEQIQWHSNYDIAANHGYSSSFESEKPLDATHLGQRLNAILRALNDLPRQARRLKRWELKRNQRLAASKPTRLSPMRPGLPPGWRERKIHEIDAVLKECHALANDLLNAPPDRS